MGEQNWKSVVTNIPKAGITENFGRIQKGGPLKFAWKMKARGRGGGGSRKSSKVIRGDHFSEITFKGVGSAKFHLV